MVFRESWLWALLLGFVVSGATSWYKTKSRVVVHSLYFKQIVEVVFSHLLGKDLVLFVMSGND